MVHLHPNDRLILQRRVEHLHALGARACVEALCEIAGRIGGLPGTPGVLGEYQERLSPELFRAAGGHRFPRCPLLAVPK
jgi:hypothetical protein